MPGHLTMLSHLKFCSKNVLLNLRRIQNQFIRELRASESKLTYVPYEGTVKANNECHLRIARKAAMKRIALKVPS